MYSSQPPIDIHCSKLVDWLVQRRHCRKDWGENLASIRRKIRSALRDMPENEAIKLLLIGSKLDYFKSKQIIEILRTTEASSKNIFGYYSSQRMKDWQVIVSSYENGCVYLAETATDLIRETNYEVPGIKKVLNKLNKEIEEREKERSNLLRKAQQFNTEYQKLAQSYGIEGVNIEQELMETSKTLVTVLDEIENLSKDLKPELDYYREFASSTSRQDTKNIVAILYYVIVKGNTTVYEFKHGYAPESIEVQEAMIKPGNSNSSEIELVDDEIDFGEESPSSDSSSGFVHVRDSAIGNSNIEETFIKVEGSDSRTIYDEKDKIARGEEAKLVLGSRKTRYQFLNNLHEIEAFFVQLSNELSAMDRSNSFFTEENSRSNKYDLSQINQVLVKIRSIIAIITKEKNRILFQINDSPNFVESIKEKFAKKSKQASDCTVKADLLIDHLNDLRAQVRETEIHLKKAIASAKEIREKVEKSVGELYSGRTINIMGCVN